MPSQELAVALPTSRLSTSDTSRPRLVQESARPARPRASQRSPSDEPALQRTTGEPLRPQGPGPSLTAYLRDLSAIDRCSPEAALPLRSRALAFAAALADAEEALLLPAPAADGGARSSRATTTRLSTRPR